MDVRAYSPHPRPFVASKHLMADPKCLIGTWLHFYQYFSSPGWHWLDPSLSPQCGSRYGLFYSSDQKNLSVTRLSIANISDWALPTLLLKPEFSDLTTAILFDVFWATLLQISLRGLHQISFTISRSHLTASRMWEICLHFTSIWQCYALL